MQDKSIRDTAIITITLIGGLFLLQKCSSDDAKIIKRDKKIETISQQKKDSQRGSLIENSSNKKDKDINLSSYKSTIHTIEMAVSNSNNNSKVVDVNISKVVDTNVSKVADVNISKVVDTNISKVTDVNISKAVDTNISKVIGTKENKDKL